MKYKAYFSNRLDALENEEFICEGETVQEVNAQLAKHPKLFGTNYWRWMVFDFGAAIDYGSWSRFIIITNAKLEDVF